MSTSKRSANVSFNPFLPMGNSAELTTNMFKSLPSGDAMEYTRTFSLTHPYKTAEEVFAALDKLPNNNRQSVYNQMSSSLKNNEEEMLKIIRRDPGAFSYLNNPSQDLAMRAMQANPAVFSLLPASMRETDMIAQAYRETMMQHMTRQKITPSEHAMMFEQQFSQKMEAERYLSEYEKAYEKMIQEGPYQNSSTLTKDAMFVAAMRNHVKDNPELIKQLDEIEKAIWMDRKNLEKLKEASYSFRDNERDEMMLEAAQERCPELKPSIERQTQKYCEDNRDQVLAAQVMQENNLKLSERQQNIFEVGIVQQRIKMMEEEKRRAEMMTKRLQESRRAQQVRDEKAREESAAAFLNDNIENVMAAYMRGDISIDAACMAAGIIDHVQSQGSPTRAMEARTYGENLEQEAQDISDPTQTEYSTQEEGHATQEEIDDAEYEQNFAGNPFQSFVPSEGMTHKRK